MKSYELVYILRTDLDQDQLESTIARINQRIAEQGGTIDFEDRWGVRRLAYPIRKFREGYYVLLRFALNGGRVPEVKRFLQLTEEVLRFMIVVAEGPPPRRKEVKEKEVKAEAPSESPAVVAPDAKDPEEGATESSPPEVLSD